MPRFFSRKSEQKSALSPSPGMYAGQDPAQLIFDKGARITVERNHWKIAALIAGIVALAAVLTREPPAPVVRTYGVSADATGKAVARELEPYQPNTLALQWAFKDLVTRQFTIEPVLTNQMEDSRLYKNIRSVKEQMIGSARKQFDDWVAEDAPFRAISTAPTLTREVKVINIATLPDSTAVAEFITTTAEDGAKPRKQRYAVTFRYQIKPPESDAVLGTNPFGVYPVFFSVQKSAA